MKGRYQRVLKNAITRTSKDRTLQSNKQIIFVNNALFFSNIFPRHTVCGEKCGFWYIEKLSAHATPPPPSPPPANHNIYQSSSSDIFPSKPSNIWILGRPPPSLFRPPPPPENPPPHLPLPQSHKSSTHCVSSLPLPPSTPLIILGLEDHGTELKAFFPSFSTTTNIPEGKKTLTRSRYLDYCIGFFTAM